MGQTPSKGSGAGWGGRSSQGASGPAVTDHDRAVLRLKVQRDKLTQSRRRLAIVVDKEREVARACMGASPPQRERAKLALRKKKRQESLLAQLESQSDALEHVIETIEFKLIEKDVLHGLEMGNKVLREINAELSVEKVDRIMDETAEGVAYQRELSDRLAQTLTMGEEREVDSELLELQRELGIVDTEAVHSTLGELPSAPNVVPKAEQKEQKEQEEPQAKAQQRQALPA